MKPGTEVDVDAFELVTLRNGSRAVRHTGHGEVMHPSVGPWAEANTLYVEQSGLARLLCTEGPPLVVMDVGLGAGTNAAAALACADGLGTQRRRRMELWSMEHALTPLRLAAADTEGFPFLQPYAAPISALLSDGEARTEAWHWKLVLADLLTAWREKQVPPADVVFFDPFSPAANPQCWTEDALCTLRTCCRTDGTGCTVFTYSASTRVRAAFLAAGFYVGVGVATGNKGETTVASTRLDTLSAPLSARWLERWHRSSVRESCSVEVRQRVETHPQFALAPGASPG
jgi:hypothetical protein